MKKRRQSSDKERRKPKQARARNTVEAIFEATAQILQREGPARLSTNRIAERAGVSISSLYQYFPDKEAVLVAMGRRQLATAQAAVAAALAQAPSLVPEQRVRLVIRSLIAPFATRRKLRRHRLETLMALGLHDEDGALRRLTEVIVVRRGQCKPGVVLAQARRLRGLAPAEAAPSAGLTPAMRACASVHWASLMAAGAR